MSKEELRFNCLDLAYKMTVAPTVNLGNHKSIRDLAQTLVEFCEQDKYQSDIPKEAKGLTPGYINYNAI